MADLMEKITALAKRRGFIFQSSEIYGGYKGFWDYGPAGVELKKNIKNEWWKTMVYNRPDVVGVDASIVMNPIVWEKSGHLKAFTDPLVECKECHLRFRTDHLGVDEKELSVIQKEFLVESMQIFKQCQNSSDAATKILDSVGIILKDLPHKDIKQEEKDRLYQDVKSFINIAEEKINEGKNKFEYVKWLDNQRELSKYSLGAVLWIYLNRMILCPNCGSKNWAEPKTFNLMTEVLLGVTEPKDTSYLRGEITQGAFVNFENVVNSTRVKIPFGIAQIGKAFRNEVTPGNLTFRSREFEQMELEYFVKPDDKESEKIFNYFKDLRMKWYIDLGINPNKLHFHDHEPEKRAHYARYATDIEYDGPFGWSEVEGIHHRGDYDLGNHGLKYRDGITNEVYTPWTIETSGGVDRATLFFLIDAYTEVDGRVVLKLNPKIAPFKVAVFPLLANKEELVNKAKDLYGSLNQKFVCSFDDRGNIGKRYFAQDEIGTPWCVTVDFQTLEDNTVTVRDRDSATQQRLPIDKLEEYFQNNINGSSK